MYVILKIGLMELASLCVIYNIGIKLFLGVKKNSHGVVSHLNSGALAKVWIDSSFGIGRLCSASVIVCSMDALTLLP